MPPPLLLLPDLAVGEMIVLYDFIWNADFDLDFAELIGFGWIASHLS